MKSLDIKLVLPYNWYHLRKIKIYDDKGNRLAKVMHNEHHQVNLDDDVEFVIIKIDYFRSEIKVPKDHKNLYLAVYMDFRDRFPAKYIDLLKRKTVTGMFLDEQGLENFDVSFYNQSRIWIQKSQVDVGNVLLGMFISIGLIVTSVWEQENEFNSLVFLIGMASFFSLLIIKLDKGKILFFDYRSRIIATGAAFFLAAFFIENDFPIKTLLILFTLVFLLQAYKNFRVVKT